MENSRRYYVLGLSIILVVGIILVFSDNRMTEFDHTGIAFDVRESRNGFTFSLDTSEDVIRCFSKVRPSDLGYYGVSGSMSDDGNILFVSHMESMDVVDEDVGDTVNMESVLVPGIH